MDRQAALRAMTLAPAMELRLGDRLGSLEVVDNVAHFFIDVLDNFNFGVGGKTEALVIQDLLQIGGDVSSGQVDSLDSVGNSVSLVDWNRVGNSIS